MKTKGCRNQAEARLKDWLNLVLEVIEGGWAGLLTIIQSSYSIKTLELYWAESMMKKIVQLNQGGLLTSHQFQTPPIFPLEQLLPALTPGQTQVRASALGL